MGSEPGVLLAKLPLEPDDPGDEHRHRQPADQLELRHS